MFVPSHAAATEDISELAQYNIDKVQEIAGKIIDLCKEPLCFKMILQRLFTEYALTMNFEQYVLVGSTVRSYLSWLKDTDRLNAIFIVYLDISLKRFQTVFSACGSGNSAIELTIEELEKY